MELSRALGLVDYERGVKLGGSGFWMYTGMGARLEWALVNWFVDQHVKAGYEFLLPPHLLLDSAGFAAGQFPKFYDDVYHLDRRERPARAVPAAHLGDGDPRRVPGRDHGRPRSCR